MICVHHFTRQDVASLDDTHDEDDASTNSSGSFCCPGPGDWLLVAGQHRVNIRDLGQQGTLAGGFPTVDCVHQLVYCQPGESLELHGDFLIINKNFPILIWIIPSHIDQSSAPDHLHF